MEALPSDHLLDQCAQAWGLRNLAFVRKMENIVFACDSDVGRVYLRLTTPLRRTRAEIEAEIHWIEHLGKCGLNVPRLIPNRAGHKIAAFSEGRQHFEAVVFAEVTGRHPSEAIAMDPQFLNTLGALIAKMHLASQSYEALHHRREEWYQERGLRHALTAAAASIDTDLKRRLDNAVSWVRQLERTPDTYGLVHADLGALNLFVDEDESISMIDFDDSCYHFFVFDLAIVLFSMAGRFEHVRVMPDEARWQECLVEGYRTIRPLRAEEVDWIPKLIDFATLRLFFWIEYHESLHTFHEEAKDKVDHLKQWTRNRITASENFKLT